MDVQKQHFNTVTREITEKVHEMAGEYDSKVLAIVLLSQAGQILQMLNSLGVMDASDTRATIAEALKDVYTPLPADKLPKVQTIGKPPRLS
jgi:hypothetical protein